MKSKKDEKLYYISERITTIRKQLKLTLADIALLLGVTSAAVGQAERNHTSLLFEIVILFAERYGINPSWILLQDNRKIQQTGNYDGTGSPVTVVDVDNLTSDQLATRIRRDVLKLKELAAEEAKSVKRK